MKQSQETLMEIFSTWWTFSALYHLFETICSPLCHCQSVNKSIQLTADDTPILWRSDAGGANRSSWIWFQSSWASSESHQQLIWVTCVIHSPMWWFSSQLQDQVSESLKWWLTSLHIVREKSLIVLLTRIIFFFPVRWLVNRIPDSKEKKLPSILVNNGAK